MTWYYALIFVPLAVFLAGFGYQTWLSLTRLNPTRKGRASYVHGSWELLSLLVIYSASAFLIVFARDLVSLAEWLFWPTGIAATALGLRGALYLAVFYGRTRPSISWLDWLFAVLHVIALAAVAVATWQAVRYLVEQQPVVSTEFYAVLMPSAIVVLLLTIVPALHLRKAKA